MKSVKADSSKQKHKKRALAKLNKILNVYWAFAGPGIFIFVLYDSRFPVWLMDLGKTLFFTAALFLPIVGVLTFWREGIRTQIHD